MLGGITYIADNPAPGRSIRGSDLGEPYGEVTCELSGNVTAPGYELRNGDSAYLRPGTTIRRVRGYTPEFRVAARYRGKLTLYEADTNPDATIGSHLLDIRGKVDYVGINSVKDGTTEIASIERRTEVSRLVHLVLEAPVDQDHATYSDADYEDQVFISFHLDDGTAVTRALYPHSGELARGILVPDEFTNAVERALHVDA
jgi:hypothetical protein